MLIAQVQGDFLREENWKEEMWAELKFVSFLFLSRTKFVRPMCEVVTDGPTQTQEIGREEKRELFPSENTFDTVFGPVQHVVADCLCNGSLNYLPPYLSHAPIHWA